MFSLCIYLIRRTIIFLYVSLTFSDFLQFLKSRQKKASKVQERNNRINVTDKEPFDDGSQPGRMKRVSFLETFSIRSESEDIRASDSHENDPVDSSVHQQKKFSHLSSLQNSSEDGDTDSTFINEERASADPQIATLDTSRSSSDPKEDTLSPFPLDNSKTEPEEKSSCAEEESCQTPPLSTPNLRDLSLAGGFTLLSSSGPRAPYMMFMNCYYSDSVAEVEPPRPKPRQRTFGRKSQTVAKLEEDAESPDFSRPQTSSTSIPLYTDTSSDPAVRTFGPHVLACLEMHYCILVYI